MNIKQEIALIDSIRNNVGYHLTKHGYRNNRRNRWVAALYVLRGQPECVARLRNVNWMPIHELLEEKPVRNTATMCVAQLQGEE